jgi:5-methylcytosine-specific restriction endonuclease McrA
VRPERHGHDKAAHPRVSKPKGCRWCGGAIPKGRRTFCSAACVHEYRLRSDARYMRDQVYKRDRGACALCGVETEAWERSFKEAGHQIHRRATALRIAGGVMRWGAIAAAEDRVRYRLGRRIVAIRRALVEHKWMSRNGHTWEADHIVPVIEGGGQCGLDNMRTLCLRCHKRVTAELRARLAGKKPHQPTKQQELSV